MERAMDQARKLYLDIEGFVVTYQGEVGVGGSPDPLFFDSHAFEVQ